MPEGLPDALGKTRGPAVSPYALMIFSRPSTTPRVAFLVSTTSRECATMKAQS